MNVTKGQILTRGLTHCCPNCGARKLFKEGTFFELNAECPDCALKIERDEGFFLGSMSLNYGVTIMGFLLPVLVLYLLGAVSGLAAAIIAGVGAIGFPVLPTAQLSASVLSAGFYFRPSTTAGEVAEWSIAPHSKCGVPKGTGGSNPSLSASFYL